jgi:hypothetical protein
MWDFHARMDVNDSSDEFRADMLGHGEVASMKHLLIEMVA